MLTPPTWFSVFGKAEGEGLENHGHVTAITVAPEYRRLGLARKMMNLLELVSDDVYKGFFVDLYVRCTNDLAINMYEGFGYSVYRRVEQYYGSLGLGKAAKDEEDAFGEFCVHMQVYRVHNFPTDMRKPLSRDLHRRSVRTNGRDIIISAREAP